MVRATVRQGNVRTLAGRGRRRRRVGSRRYRKRALRRARVPTRAIKAIVTKTLAKRSETKMHSIFGNMTPTGAWIRLNLTEIPQGDNPQQRDGSACFVKSVSINTFAVLDPNANHDFIRWMLVDFINGEDGTAGDVLTDVTSAVNSLVTMYRCVDNPAGGVGTTPVRYRVLAAGEEYLNQTTKQTDLNRIRVKLNKKFQWDDSDTTGANHVKHRLSFFLLAVEPVGPTTIHYKARVYYTDS